MYVLMYYNLCSYIANGNTKIPQISCALHLLVQAISICDSHYQTSELWHIFCRKNKLPVPGGPYRSTPFGWAMPSASNNSGCFTGSSITSLISLICLSRPPTISYVLSGTFSTIMSDTRGSTCSNQIQLWKYGSSLRTNTFYVCNFVSDGAYFNFVFLCIIV